MGILSEFVSLRVVQEYVKNVLKHFDILANISLVGGLGEEVGLLGL